MSDQRYLLNLISTAVLDLIDRHGDGRCGVVVSGGLDSSTVACMADRLGYRLPVFTGWYDAPGFDERQWARLVPGGDRHEIQITPLDFVENFDAMAAAVRPPYQGMGTFGQYMVGKHIAGQTGVKAVLSGEGSDELFGGYARQTIVARGAKVPDGYEGYVLPAGYPIDHREALDYDYARLGDLLAVDDQCMAAHRLQAVAPFTDPRIAAFAHGLTLGDRVNKDFLRATVRGLVPDAIIDRTDKMGFPIPLVEWAQTDPVRTFVHDRIGYLPDPGMPWDRAWFHELIMDATREAAAA